jgi:RNA polymerase sigma-70 factor, ECF subfamily
MDVSFAVEQELIRRARVGDENAFAEIVEAFTPALFRVIHRMVADTGEAEGIVQESFWRVWQVLPRYQNDRRFFPYLVTIGVNLVRDGWRKERRFSTEGLDSVMDLPSGLSAPEKQVEDAQLIQGLAEAVEKLPALYRNVIALRYDAGLSYEDIALAMQLPLNTVRTYLHRAKSALRDHLKDSYG